MLNCNCYIAILEPIKLCAKKSSGPFKKVFYEMCLQIINIQMYMYKQDLALDNLQWLICHKAKLNQIIYI